MRPLGLVVVVCALGGVAAPLDALPWPFESSASSTTASATATATTTTSLVNTNSNLLRLRPGRARRPEWCREQLARKADELPALVAVVRIKEVYLSGADAMPPANASALGAEPHNNRALATVTRVIRGKRELLNSDIVISGFNASQSALTQCPNFVKPNDTFIALLNQADASWADSRKYSIQGNNLLSMNLNNLDKINALAADEPPKRRPPIEDILCEAHYCAFGRCKVVDPDKGQVRCECPDSCPPALPNATLCASDNTSYASECHMIREGCKRQKPLFVTKEVACST